MFYLLSPLGVNYQFKSLQKNHFSKFPTQFQVYMNIKLNKIQDYKNLINTYFEKFMYFDF
jgi:hypothetical protein